MLSISSLLSDFRAETVIPEAIIALSCFFLGEFSARWRDRRRERIERERANKQNRYTWEDFVEGADKVGKRLVSQFKPDVVISFAGPGAVFANLVLAKTLNRKSLSATKLYMGRFLDKNTSPDAAISEEYDIVTGERLHVLLPKSLQQGDRSWKILILDETVTTGSSMRAIRKYFNDLGYRNIRAGCLVCCDAAKLVDPHTVDFAAYSNVGNAFVLPWGKSPL